MLVGKVMGLEHLTARLARRAAQIISTDQAARALAPEARWRRAALLWPGFGSDPPQG